MMMISKKICARRTKSLGASTVDEVINSVVPKGTKNTTSISSRDRGYLSKLEAFFTAIPLLSSG